MSPSLSLPAGLLRLINRGLTAPTSMMPQRDASSEKPLPPRPDVETIAQLLSVLEKTGGNLEEQWSEGEGPGAGGGLVLAETKGGTLNRKP